MSMNNGSLYLKVQNKVATLEFYHPASNSLPGDLLSRLENAFFDLDKNEEVLVIILKSEKHTTFCAGASFDELMAVKNLEEGKEFFSGFARVINAMRKCRKPIIGRIQGKAVGGGVGLIAACDYCMATEDASVKLSELSIGIGPFVIAPVVERKIGVAAFAQLTFEPKTWKTAYWAKEKGLFAHVYLTISELDDEVEILADKLTSYNPEALYAMKKVFWEGTAHWDELLIERAAVSGELVLSDFTKEALNKFKK